MPERSRSTASSSQARPPPPLRCSPPRRAQANGRSRPGSPSWRRSSRPLIIIGSDRGPRRDAEVPKLARLARLLPRSVRRGARVVGDLLAPLQPRLPGALLPRRGVDARVDRPAAGGDLPGLRAVPRPVALREHAGPPADRARRGPGRSPHTARARDAAVADAGAAERPRLLSDRAHLPDGGQPLRLPDLEGAPALQPAARARRAR